MNTKDTPKPSAPLRRQSPEAVIKVGMKVTINGALFEVRKLTHKDVVLRALPVREMPSEAKA